MSDPDLIVFERDEFLRWFRQPEVGGTAHRIKQPTEIDHPEVERLTVERDALQARIERVEAAADEHSLTISEARWAHDRHLAMSRPQKALAAIDDALGAALREGCGRPGSRAERERQMAERTTYRIDIERIGRGCKGVSVELVATDLDDLAEQMHRYARKHLASSWFEVMLDGESGHGSIDGGRFGRFTFAAVEPVA